MQQQLKRIIEEIEELKALKERVAGCQSEAQKIELDEEIAYEEARLLRLASV